MESNAQQSVMRESKKLPIVVWWGEKPIHIGEIEFLTDGSLVFDSKLHNESVVNGPVQIGTSSFIDNQFQNHIPDEMINVSTGVHISLHPPTDTQNGVMHFREHAPGPVLSRREIDWYPVHQAFNLIRLFTPPLDQCEASQKRITIERHIDPGYNDSLELIIDIFPRDVKEARPYPNSAEAWGHCPDYRARLTITPANQRTMGLMYWPIDGELSL
jgi:hypothetical protein